MSENSTLRIHTQLNPDAARPIVPDRAERQRRRRLWGKGMRFFSKDRSARTPKAAGRETPRRGRPGGREKLSVSDRLLRNSAIACAVLLAVLALGNLRQPWAQKAVESIEQAVTMRINLDDSLGQLTFVRNLMPESTLVFLNVSGKSEMVPPVSEAVSHSWSALQPWLMFKGDSAPVSAVASGTVTAVSTLSDGQYGVLLDHGEGLESVYAGLSEVSVKSGDAVSRGQSLGTSGDGLYYEMRNGGESIDPSERLGLK